MAIIENPRTLDMDDIQGLLTRGYAKLPRTAYFHLKITDSQKAKNWLKEVLPHVDSADHEDTPDCIAHLAIAVNGLRELGLNEQNIAQFPITYREGISTENRNRILGDYGQNAPEHWLWGAQNDEHILMILHATSEEKIQEFIDTHKGLVDQSGGLSITRHTLGYRRPDGKEPFGFHDGISQPVIKGTGQKSPENDLIETGEFLLGHLNEHGHYPDTPILVEEQGDPSLLKNDPQQSNKKSLGYNGTFMVFRQMEQDVEAFWKAMEEFTLNEDGSVNEDEKLKLAAKCIGRWPSGAALVNYPDGDPGGNHENDDYGYADKDPDGLKCPFGAHMRRNNPRDSFRWYDKKQSLKITRRHRIIRRGRRYDTYGTNGDIEAQGTHFICFNASLELQYEFVQHVWANNNQMRHLTNDVDVIVGVPDENNPNNPTMQFTVQSEPVNKFYEGWKQFVTIRGGAYFFFPSISTLNFLTTI